MAVTVTGFILKQKPPHILLKIGLVANILWSAIFALMSMAMLTGSGNKSLFDIILLLLGWVGMGAFGVMNFRHMRGR